MNCVRALRCCFWHCSVSAPPSFASDPPVLTNLPSGPGQHSLKPPRRFTPTTPERELMELFTMGVNNGYLNGRTTGEQLLGY
jgi:hypothetical protein